MSKFGILCVLFAVACGGAEATVGNSTTTKPAPTADWSKAVPWTTFQGTNARTGYMPVTVDTAAFKFRWSKSINAGFDLSSVVEGGGNVYATINFVAHAQSGVMALDISDGTEKWLTAIPGGNGFYPPVYADGAVYIQPEGVLLAFDAVTGAIRYTVPMFSGSYYGVAVDGPTIYAGCRGPAIGAVCARRASNGDSLWLAPTNYDDQWAPLVSNGVVYAYTAGGAARGPVDLRAVSGATGQLLFAVADSDPNFSLPPGVSALGSMNDLITTEGGRLLSFDLLGHKINWVVSSRNGGTVAVAKGVIYTFGLGFGTLAVEARNESDGKLLWAWQTGEGTSGYLVVTDNILFVETNSATHAIDLATHEEVWSYPAAGRMSLSALGVLFIADSRGVLTAITVE